MKKAKHPSEIPCGKCGAQPGQSCHNRGVHLRGFHDIRIVMAATPPPRMRQARIQARAGKRQGWLPFMTEGKQ